MKLTHIVMLALLLIVSQTYAVPDKDHLTFGPTTKDSRLWDLAKTYSPEGPTTLGQTIVAILKKNERAFLYHNINGLKSGYMLHIPSENEIYAITRPEAIRFIRQQNLEWKQQNITKQHQSNFKPNNTAQVALLDIHDPDHRSLMRYLFVSLVSAVILLILIFKLIRPKKNKGIAKSDDQHLDVAEFAGDNELDTQLDLCRGLIQQGHKEHALQLIHNVIAKGSEAQQQEAKQFLSEIKS